MATKLFTREVWERCASELEGKIISAIDGVFKTVFEKMDETKEAIQTQNKEIKGVNALPLQGLELLEQPLEELKQERAEGINQPSSNLATKLPIQEILKRYALESEGKIIPVVERSIKVVFEDQIKVGNGDPEVIMLLHSTMEFILNKQDNLLGVATQKQLLINVGQNIFKKKKKIILQQFVQLGKRRWMDCTQNRYWIKKFQIEYD